MLFPFRHEVDELFRGDRSIWLKMLGAALAADYIAIQSMDNRQGRPAPMTAEAVVYLLGAAVAGAGIAIFLSLRDVVANRQAAGQDVHWFLLLFFAQGCLSIFIQVVTAFVLILVIVIILTAR